MPDKEGGFKKTRRARPERFFSFPRVSALVAVCALAVSPFLPWLETGLTLRDLTTRLVETGALSINLWPLPLALAVLFLLPLFTDLRVTRAVYYVLLIETVVVAAAFLYPPVPGMLMEAGIIVHVPSYGFFLFLGAFALLAWSAIATLWQTRLGIAVLTLMVLFTGAVVAGYLTSWFGYLTGEPKVWHQEYETRVPEGQAMGVQLNILNKGWGNLRLGLPATRTREVDMIMSAQRYYRIGDYWGDVPLEDLISEHSEAQLPAELKPGDVLALELVFGPLTRAAQLYAFPRTGASGRYRIVVTDSGGRPVAQHEIQVAPAAEPR